MWEGELAFRGTLLKSISPSSPNTTLTTCPVIQTAVSSPPSVSPACRENGILTALPPCFPPLPVHHTPQQGPVLLLGVSPLAVALFWASPRELFGAPTGKVIILPCSWEWEGWETEIPTPQSIPAIYSHLVPALCSWITGKAPHSSAWAGAFAPCCCSTCHTPVVEGGLSHCLWYETLGCWVQQKRSWWAGGKEVKFNVKSMKSRAGKMRLGDEDKEWSWVMEYTTVIGKWSKNLLIKQEVTKTKLMED